MRSKILSDYMQGGDGLDNFFTATRCLGLVKCFTIFQIH